MEETKTFDIKNIDNENIKKTLKEIFLDLENHGYDACKQIVGYLVSGDPGYISSYKECRSKILSLDRNCILEYMVKEYLK